MPVRALRVPVLRGGPRLLVVFVVVSLAACAGAPRQAPPGAPGVATPSPPALRPGADPCAVVYEHDEADYTAGGLYRPGQRDHGPDTVPDYRRIPEAVPRSEPRSRYGNRPSYTVLGREYQVLEDGTGYVERGLASWYGAKFHGRPTSSMEPYDMCAFTAAHKSLPLPSYAEVTNLQTGQRIVVRINDRGPFHEGRIIDLSYVAALKLGIHQRGVGEVEVRAIPEGQPHRGGSAVASVPAATSRATAPGAPGSDGGWLQVGSFGERANARAAAQRLRGAGIGNVETRSARVAGQRVWRVRVGPVGSAAEIEQLGRRISALGLGPPQRVGE